MSEIDVEQHTTRMIDIWNKVANGWHKWSDHIATWTMDSTLQMIKEAEIRNGSMVLDVAAGDGNQSFLAAELVGDRKSVV